MSSVDKDLPSKRAKNESKESSELCNFCRTRECTQMLASDESTSGDKQSETSVELPLKDSIGDFYAVPNEVIEMMANNMSLTDLSKISLTNKWFRDFVLQYFRSKNGLKTLLGQNYSAKDATVGQKPEEVNEKQQKRLQMFFEFGLLLKRVTCLLPTEERIRILIGVFNHLDGIPYVSLNPMANQNMRFVFQCYGRMIRHFVSGWDNSELKHVFKTLQTITKMKEIIKSVDKNPIGARNPNEYYIRSFYRMVCIDPHRPLPSNDKIRNEEDDRLYWINAILRKHSLTMRARLLLIIFGPLIAQTSPPHSIPYVGYWDLTDTFFFQTGLNELGDAFRLLFCQTEVAEQRNSVISLMESVMKTPTNWLSENVAALLFYAGDELTFEYLWTKLEKGNYSEVAQKLVYLTLVTHKLTKGTKYVYNLIQDLATNEHRINLYNEIPIAFCEAVTDIENTIELEDERDVCEVHEIIEANNDLMKNFMIKSMDDSSQQSKCSSKDLTKDMDGLQLLVNEE